MQGKAIAVGCVLLGAVLIWSAIAQARSGVTLSGRGGPSGPIYRDESPGYFWFLFWVRVVLGLAAVIGGVVSLQSVR